MMNNETLNITHSHEFKLLGDFFRCLERQGPFYLPLARQALTYCAELPARAQIADLGCGTGGQTRQLARALPHAVITAVDLMPAFTERFEQEIAGTELERRITVLNRSMDALSLAPKSLDLIWSEGAIAHIGFEEGLRYWGRFLKPGGYVVVTEATWFRENPPAEVVRFWNENYPDITTAAEKTAAMQRAGYLPIARMPMPEAGWMDYYRTVEARYEGFLREQNFQEKAQSLVDRLRHEAHLYDRFKAYYGYTYFIGRKV
ncbi:MAG: class I SAM-dependent methyltransferase [Rikenellaceae bacterium]|nr:class I SAM-dependent methyltransferase [Rikenellaceae bacterium]